ncbi:MAG: DUF5615 family PIN-like protein [Thermoflexales bacterium]
MRFLADENIIGDAVTAIRARGHDDGWITEISPGISDLVVLSRAQTDGRTVLTCDKDFGELAFRVRAPAIAGIVLFRLAGLAPEEMATLMVRSLESQQTWERVFAVVSRDRIRVVPLPAV